MLVLEKIKRKKKQLHVLFVCLSNDVVSVVVGNVLSELLNTAEHDFVSENGCPKFWCHCLDFAPVTHPVCVIYSRRYATFI